MALQNASAQSGSEKPTAKTGSRSPMVSASFPQALEMGEKVYAANHRHPVGDEAVALALGAKSLNGTSSAKIATLKKFGVFGKHKRRNPRQ